MTIQLLYHDPNSPGGISPFDAAIRSIALEGNLRLACPYISLDYLNEVINGTSWRLLTDIKELLRTQAPTQRERVVEFLSDHRASVRHYSRLHAKVVIGLRTVMFGSANFTNSGIWQRAEVSAIIEDAIQVQELTEWFDACWFQSRELPPKDALDEYIKSLPEPPAPAEEDDPQLFPPLFTKPAAELEVQQAATGEAAEQPPAQEAEPAPEDDLDDVVFSHVRPSSAVEVTVTKRRRSERGKREYLFCLIRIGKNARREDIPFLQALAAKSATLSPERFGPNPNVPGDERERQHRNAVRIARTVSEATLPALRAAASDVRLNALSNQSQYSEEYYPEIREELGVK